MNIIRKFQFVSSILNLVITRVFLLLALLLVPLAAQVDTLYVDFGSSNLQTSSPDSQGHYWNNVTNLTPTGLPNLVNDLGQASSISLQVTGAININPFGTTVPNLQSLLGLAVSTATQDWFYVSDVNVINVTLRNLAPDGVYRLSLFGSRDSEDIRVTKYDVVGLTTEVRRLTTSGSGIGIAPQSNANRSDLAIFENLRPDSDGSLIISVRRDIGPFGYLGALRLETMNVVNSPPSANGVIAWGAPRVGSALVGRYNYSDRENDLEANSIFMWERSSSPSSLTTLVGETGAAGGSYVPSTLDLGSYIRFVVIPKSLTGRGSGTSFYSPWVGPISSPETFRSYHIGSSYTQWPNMPLQLKSLSASRGIPIVTGWQVTSGRTSQYHWDNGLNGSIGAGTYSRYDLTTGSWDAVVLQPFNTEWQPSNISQAIDYGKRFYNLADSNGSQFYLYAAWPSRSQDLSLQTNINAAFEVIRASVSSNGNKSAFIIPAGEAFRAVIQEAATGCLKLFNVNGVLDRQNLYIDDLHQTDLGAYVSALTHYATVMKRSPVGLPAQALSSSPFNDNQVELNPLLASRIQEIVWWVVANFPHSGVHEVVAKPVAPIVLPSDSHVPEPVYITRAAGTVDSSLLGVAFGVSLDGVTPLSSHLPHPAASMALGRIEIEYVINPDAETQQVTFTPEWSENLVQWTQVQPLSTVITRTGQTVRVSWPKTSRWRFMRVYVSKP